MAIIPYDCQWAISEKVQTGEMGGGGCGYTFLKTPFWNFSGFFYFTLKIPDKTKLNLDIPQNYVKSLGNSKAKNKNPSGNSTLLFFLVWSPLEIPVFN